MSAEEMSPDESDSMDVPAGSAPAPASASASESTSESTETNIDTTVTVTSATDAESLDPQVTETTTTVAPSASDIDDIDIPAVVPIVPTSDHLTTPPPPPSSIPTLHPRYLILSSDSDTPSWSNHLTTDAHTFYIGFFIILLFVWQTIVRLPIFSRLLTSKPPPTPPITSPVITVSTDRNNRESFQRFQRSYAGVFFLMSAADWLQGPYVYALYNYYGFDKGTIGQLFIIGFASSLVCGTMVGSLADKYGRKKLCLTYGIIYSIASATKHFNDFWILAFGRLLSGISTSILYSSFEAWMIHQHHVSGYPEEWLSQTFAMCTMGNGIVAIVSGVCAWGVNSIVGPVGPFDLAIVCLITGTIVISVTWSENRGNAEAGLSTSFLHAASTAAKDPKIVLLGFTQSLFEGSMYVFVFMWTPTLEESSNNTDVHHGWVFASFMLCVLIGSSIFRLLLASGRRVEMILLGALITASVAIITPALIQRHIIQLCAFCIFESCVGIFWPTMGTLRSRLVPEDVRATIMTFFRIPLNIIVVLTLTNIKNLSSHTVFTLCFSCILLSALCLYRLTRYGIAERTSTSQHKHDISRQEREQGEKENIKMKSIASPTRVRATSPAPPLSSASVIGTRRRRTLDVNQHK